MQIFEELSNEVIEMPPTLAWFPAFGFGYHPYKETGLYDADYFDNYQRLALTDTGKLLTEFRVKTVAQYCKPGEEILDVGIGAGQFIRAMYDAGFTRVFGYDVNRNGAEYLRLQKWYYDFPKQSKRGNQVKHATFWDTLEHIPDICAAIDAVEDFAFITMPTYDGPNDCFKSKHYKPNEHIWYFTPHGLKAFMNSRGFVCVDVLDNERQLGRESVDTFIFKRKAGK